MRPDLLLLAAALLATPVAAQDRTPLTLQLNWLPQGEHFGFFEAKAGGLYEAEGLDVTILGGGPDVNVPLLAGGQADLAMGSSFAQMNLLTGGIDQAQMRDPGLVTGDGALPIGAMTAVRWTGFANSMIAAGLVPADFDISTGYDPSFLSP